MRKKPHFGNIIQFQKDFFFFFFTRLPRKVSGSVRSETRDYGANEKMWKVRSLVYALSRINALNDCAHLLASPRPRIRCLSPIFLHPQLQYSARNHPFIEVSRIPPPWHVYYNVPRIVESKVVRLRACRAHTLSPSNSTTYSRQRNYLINRRIVSRIIESHLSHI